MNPTVSGDQARPRGFVTCRRRVMRGPRWAAELINHIAIHKSKDRVDHMKKLIDLSNEEARKHFLKGSSYFNADIPSYISFEPILTDVAAVLNGGNYPAFKSANPKDFPDVNYNFLANKDGKFAWRPLELIHPAIVTAQL